MNTMKYVALVAALSLAGVSHAQQTSNSTSTLYNTRTLPSVAENPGTIGQGYTDLGFSVEDLAHQSKDAYNANLRANVPLTRSVDAGLAYNYWWYDGPQKSHYNMLAADTKFYVPLARGIKPFVGGQVGYQWVRADVNGVNVRFHDNRWVWGTAVGVEVPVGSWAFTPQVGYTDTMEANSTGNYHYGMEAHHWFTERVGGYADVTYNELRHAPNSWTYSAGVRLRY